MTAPPSANEEYFRLRAEWLRFKNHVIDSNTGLPTLAAGAPLPVCRQTVLRGTVIYEAP